MRHFITILFLSAIFYNGSLKAQNYYTVKFPDDKTLYGCGISADTTWPLITQYTCNFAVGVAIKDQKFYTNDAQTCYKILRKWTLVNWCDYNPNWPSPYVILNPLNSDVGPTVVGNAQNHGYIEYTQIIKVVDNIPPVFLNCPSDPVVFCDLTGNDPTQYNSNFIDKCEGPVNLNVSVTDLCSKADINLSYRLFLDMDNNGTMETYISSSDVNAWPIESTVVGDTLKGKIKFPTGFGLPYGTHKVEWIANDHCAGESTCKYTFIVKDCKAPTVVCMNGLSINIMQTGMITLWDSDFIQYFYDNCTTVDQIKIGIRKANTGTGFPYDSHSVTFDCTELGTQYVEIWAQDAYGNADYCLTFVNVQDNMGSCPPMKISGQILNEVAASIEGATITLKKNQSNTIAWTAQTDSLGQYSFLDIPAAGPYTLSASASTAAQKGINVLDALLASAHAHGMLTLDSPYKMIAADTDGNDQIEDQDVLQIMQLITGQLSEFSGAASWQFIPKTFVFPNPALPLATPFPTQINLNNNLGNHDFVAVKTGDLNLSSVQNAQGVTEARSNPLESVSFSTIDYYFKKDEDFELEILSPDLDGLAAFQTWLQYNKEVLQLTAVDGLMVPNEQIGLDSDNGLIKNAWVFPEALDGISGKNHQEVVIVLHFHALQHGFVRDYLSIDSDMTHSVAYTDQFTDLPVSLVFKARPEVKNEARLLPPQPNPVQDQFTAVYYLPDDTSGNLRITDINGQLIWSAETAAGKGMHYQRIDLSDTQAHGLLFLQLESVSGNSIQKIIRH